MKLNTLLFLSLISLSLSACMSGAVIGSTAVAGSVILFDKRSTTTMVEDHNITQQIGTKIAEDKTLQNNSHISVAAFNHLVLLTGQAPSVHARNNALKYAQQTKNVKRVYNEIRIGKPTTALTRTNDTWLTTKVKTNMLTTDGLRSGQITVVTEDATVYLMGLVNHLQADMATDVARQVTGVKKVVKLFEYLDNA